MMSTKLARAPLALLSFSGAILIGCLGCMGGGAGTGDSQAVDLFADGSCEAFLACVAEAEPSSLDAKTLAYGPESTCWGDPQTAETCEQACEAEFEGYAANYPEVVSCGGSGYPAGCPFEEGRWTFEVVSFTGDGEMPDLEWDLTCVDADDRVFVMTAPALDDLEAQCIVYDGSAGFTCDAYYDDGGDSFWDLTYGGTFHSPTQADGDLWVEGVSGGQWLDGTGSYEAQLD